MLEELRELWKFRELLLSLVQRELKIRYKNSVLGFLWSFINPLVTMVVITVVFEYLVGISVPNYSAYILAAMLPFLFFQQALLDASQSVLAALPMVKKVYFPREVLPLAVILSNFIHFLLALVVFFAFLLVVFVLNPKVSPFQVSVVYLPILLVIQLAMVTGLGLLVSALNTFYEDVKYVLSVGLYLLFYLCPIIYFSENVRYRPASHGLSSNEIYTIYHLNPEAMMVTAFRKILLAPQPVRIKDVQYQPMPLDVGLLAVTTAFSLFILWFGYRTFNRLKWKFVERP